ncbi:hypothetical protein B0H10DRAFT_1948905 [Mycena sp. CBHHK59/15]|nr:hypothetical protein B0H10DRAFT_1948905 [Mycena sp. CBHHK59/15]
MFPPSAWLVPFIYVAGSGSGSWRESRVSWVEMLWKLRISRKDKQEGRAKRSRWKYGWMEKEHQYVQMNEEYGKPEHHALKQMMVMIAINGRPRAEAVFKVKLRILTECYP